MEYINKQKTAKVERPIKVVQFGEGNFLRAFVDYMIDIANERGVFNGDVVLIKPIEFGSLDRFHKQECQYTVQLRGIVDNKPQKINRIVTSVTDAVDPYKEYEKYNDLAKLDTLKFVVSNTTEAGIVFDENDNFDFCPPISYPGKLTKFLYTRFEKFGADPDKGLVMLPVELIDDNGLHLKECVLKLIEKWNLPDEFKTWVEEACVFTSTLVDRIVTGYPKDEAASMCEEFGYQDDILVTGEPFALWVIESSRDISEDLPLPKAGLPVVFTEDHHPYKQRKVRILNGAHTSFVLASYLCGNDIVLESMKDPTVLNYIKRTLYEEIIPTLTLPKEDCEEFAKAVLTRFENPYVKHEHLAIALNSVSKWRARCMPSFVGYIEKFGNVPAHLAFSLAALMSFYTGESIEDNALIGLRNGQKYQIRDDAAVLNFFKENSNKDTKAFVHATLTNLDFWGQDLSLLPDVENTVAGYLEDIRTNGARSAVEKLG